MGARSVEGEGEKERWLRTWSRIGNLHVPAYGLQQACRKLRERGRGQGEFSVGLTIKINSFLTATSGQ